MHREGLKGNNTCNNIFFYHLPPHFKACSSTTRLVGDEDDTDNFRRETNKF